MSNAFPFVELTPSFIVDIGTRFLLRGALCPTLLVPVVVGPGSARGIDGELLIGVFAHDVPAEYRRMRERWEFQRQGRFREKSMSDNSRARTVVVASFLGWALDAFDFFLMVFVFSDIAREFGVTITTVTIAITLTLAMRPLGAVIFGHLVIYQPSLVTLCIESKNSIKLTREQSSHA